VFPATARASAAYHATVYRCRWRGRTLEMRIGAAPPPLPWGAKRQAVFLSACNPEGRLRSAAANRRASRRLRASLAGHALLLDASGEALSSDWPAEANLLVFGITARAAAALGRRWRQNAVLWLCRQRPVALRALR
jgi:hypothetical protein